MRITLAVLGLALLPGCSGPSPEERNAQIERTIAEINTYVALSEEVAAVKKPQKQEQPEVYEPPQGDELCWQDYCPCDEPQGGPDRMLCRQLKAGVYVDPEMLSIAAGMRDARQQIEDFEEENGRM